MPTLDIAERGVNVRRGGTLFWCEIDVTRAHREAVGLSHNWADSNFHRDIQIAHHAANNESLLGVLLAEESDVRLHDIEELEDDRAHAAKVAGAAEAAEMLGERRFFDPGGEIGRVHIGGVRCKDQIYAFFCAGAAVGSEGTRVFLKVLFWTELRGVDEDGDDDPIAVATRGAYEGQVAFVQSAHGGDEGDAQPLRTPGGAECGGGAWAT